MRAAVTAAGQRGFGLLELVIAVLVLSIGVMAAFRALDQAQAQVAGETARMLALNAARNRAAELALVGAAAGRALPRQIAAGPYAWTVEVDEAATEAGMVEATIRLVSDLWPGAVLVTFIDAEARP